jgi:hypothetical protein
MNARAAVFDSHLSEISGASNVNLDRSPGTAWPKFATKKQSIEGIDSFFTAAI